MLLRWNVIKTRPLLACTRAHTHTCVNTILRHTYTGITLTPTPTHAPQSTSSQSYSRKWPAKSKRHREQQRQRQRPDQARQAAREHLHRRRPQCVFSCCFEVKLVYSCLWSRSVFFFVSFRFRACLETKFNSFCAWYVKTNICMYVPMCVFVCVCSAYRVHISNANVSIKLKVN